MVSEGGEGEPWRQGEVRVLVEDGDAAIKSLK